MRVKKDESKMKEVPPIKTTLPPKKSGAGKNAAITPTKAPPDEILSALLRLNNHDSFSSIKDESLDIDLSACVTINAGDSAQVLNGNSFSSTDFWRMLDENAQATQLELACASGDESMSKMSDAMQDASNSLAAAAVATTTTTKSNNFESTFSDKFLRPQPPAAVSNARKTPVKLAQQHFNVIDHKILNGIPKDLTITRIERPSIIKLEPIDQLPDIIIEEERVQSPLSFEQTHQQQQQLAQSANAEMAGAAAAAVEPAEPLHKCLTCNGLILRTPQEQTTHDLASHRIIHACSQCEREFEQEAALKKHLKTHKTVEARKDSWRKCPDCGKCLKLGSMWMHRKIHSDNKKYACDICGQKFVQKINLTHHSRVHTAEKPYECPECQKRFQERSHLQRHQKYHAQTRSYRCEKCGKMYKTERCLKVHNLVHLEQRPFACNVCDKSFISNSKLKQHSNIHTGERPFKCNYCPRDFTNFPNWLKHTRRRHKVDHKTGLQLENIPSYCSKKSTKTAKPAAAAGAAVAKTQTNGAATATKNNNEQLQPIAAKPPKATATKIAKIAAAPPPTTTNTTNMTATLADLTKINEQLALATTAAQSVLAAKQQQQQQQQQQFAKMAPPKLPLTATTTNNSVTNITATATSSMASTTVKATKVKRERKQPMPRQVQKSPKISMSTLGLVTNIKQEVQAPDLLPPTQATATGAALNTKAKNSHTDFPDLHGLSLTSAEELIMEQALEMEECGLYDAPSTLSTIGDTDNAISAEAAAALQFKIKSEFIDCQDDLALKEPNKRLLCSSLESSPYSSPASIELPAAAAATTPTAKKLPISPTHSALQMELMATPLTTFYMQPFQFNGAATTPNSNGAMLTRLCSTANGMTFCDTTTTTTTTTTQAKATSTSMQQLLPQMLQQQQQQQQHQTPNNNNSPMLNEVSLPTTTQAFLNHFFLPMSVNMQQQQQQPNNNKHQQQQQQQVLPSVETLLFSAAHANAASLFANSNSAATSTQAAAPPPTITLQRNLS